MKFLIKIVFLVVPLLIFSQHSSKMSVKINIEEKILLVNQVLTYNNTSNDTLKYIILNDWNNAFSSKSSALAKRFSDEYIRAFHLATEKERGFTDVKNMIDTNFKPLKWSRSDGNIDLIKVELNEPILPCTKQTFTFIYEVKIPDSKFTKYGYDNNGRIILKNWYLNPSRFEHKQFIKDNWAISVEPVQATIRNRFTRLKLKGQPIHVMDPVTCDEVDLLKRHLRELFPLLNLNKLQKAHTKNVDNYQKWIEAHCRTRHYTFQIRKCKDPDCCLPAEVPEEALY
ncbi:MAG: hypothetical protein NWP90_05185, partial [Flavobacterium sp.]|nr:hypothetical protein [Flavobacterium sp.]